ncbi:glycoside hydrolase, partial [Thozetella sp. PMI_491]
GTFYKELNKCPLAGNTSDPQTWIVYNSARQLQTCNQSMLLDFALYAPLDSPNTIVKLRACTVSSGNVTVKATDSGSSCSLDTAKEAKIGLDYSSRGTSPTRGDDAIAVLDRLHDYFEDANNCQNPFMFAYFNNTVAGIYIGKSFGWPTVSSVVDGLKSKMAADGTPESLVSQICGDERNAHHVVGIAIDTTGNLAAVQSAVKSWKDGGCATGFEEKSALPELSVWESIADLSPAVNGTISLNSTTNGTISSRKLQARGDCRTISVISGDGCGTLASKCGISGADFTKYNPDKDLCSSLVEDQRVCCSEGTLPDIAPKQNADGSCFWYHVISGDNCSKLAAKNGIKMADIEKYNKETTWGWRGCDADKFLAGINICLSSGTPPTPAPQDGAKCGPTVPGTTFDNTGSTELKDLNPCPLNVCCNVWGQCGIDEDFCIEQRADTGNPGTSKGQNGCVSSCGMDIKKGDAPANFRRIGYFESWNYNRPCLKMRAVNANTDGSYTHIHWAFMSIDTATWTPVINNTGELWDEFKALKDVKRVVSFGGWGYSTEIATYDILREAMSPANRVTFSNNLVKFMNDEGLDGVDFDWEYPGATDIDGTPPGYETDGPNYLKFLITLRSKIPSGKTMSIAAPASYWYLKAFPIAQMADSLDYIVYMTYDLHGQWDAGNQYSMYGCDTGNCLRSHVNLTETQHVLSMITKAGVNTNKIFVGESSYGRSFHMAEAGCTGPLCKFTGDRLHSEAEKGACTDTAGYISNAEIDELITFGEATKTWHDADSNSDMMVYHDTEWVAYMSPTTKDTRRKLWQRFNFAGTIDWAVDLQAYTTDDELLDDDWDYDFEYPDAPDALSGGTPESSIKCDNSKTYATLDDVANDNSVSVECKPRYILGVLANNLTKAMSHYDDLMKDGYDKKFGTYADAVVKGARKTVDKFMREHGNDYFSCTVTEMTLCCDKCKTQAPGFPGACTYCFDGDCTCNPASEKCEHSATKRGLEFTYALNETLDGALYERDRPPPGEGLESKNIIYKNYSEPCPPDYSKRGLGQGDPIADTVWWSLNSDKRDNFFADIYSATGISEENIKFTDVSNSPGDECLHGWEECHWHNWDMGIAVPDHYEKDDVLNPKDTASKAHDNLKDAPSQVTDVLGQIKQDKYGGSAEDVVDAISIPLFMLEEALENMDQVVEVADEIDEAKRKAIIFAFLSALLFFIPIAGEIAGAIAGVAAIARIAALIGTLGDVAMDIYSLVDDPSNAPLAIFGLITGPLAIMDIAQIAKAARVKRGMATDDVKKLGDNVSAKVAKLDKIKT